MTRLSVVIVSWNVRRLLRRCLASIYQSLALSGREHAGPEDLEIQVIVVDNGSRDRSVDMVKARFPQVELIANQVNRGFTTANNQGIARAQGEYTLLLNPDTEVLGNALAEMVTFADHHRNVGMIGPQLLNPDGTVQSSRRRFPTLATAFVESTWLQYRLADVKSGSLVDALTTPLRRLLERYYVADRPDDVTQDVDWVTGAAMLARREAVEEVGLLDEGFFMYSEELDWCRRLREADWRVVYLPTAQIVHHAGKSSEQVVAARDVHFHSSKVHYVRKYHGALAAEVLRWYLLANYGLQLGIEAAKWLLGHRRPLRAQRMTAYGQVLRSGLRRSPPEQ